MPLSTPEILNSLAEAVYFAPWTSTERKSTLGNCRLAGNALNTCARSFLFQVVIIGSHKRWAERVALLVRLVDDDPTLLKCIKRIGVILEAPHAEKCVAPLAELLSRIVEHPEAALEGFRIDDPRPFIAEEPLKSALIRLLWSGRVKKLSMSSIPSNIVPAILSQLHPSITMLSIAEALLSDRGPLH